MVEPTISARKNAAMSFEIPIELSVNPLENFCSIPLLT